MYGCSDGVIVYGFLEEDREFMICDDFLEKFQIRAYCADVVRNYAGNYIYGIQCKLDKKTGAVSLTKKEKAAVEKAHKEALKSGHNYGHLGVSSDCDSHHTEYDPRDDDEEEEDKEEEEEEEKVVAKKPAPKKVKK